MAGTEPLPEERSENPDRTLDEVWRRYASNADPHVTDREAFGAAVKPLLAELDDTRAQLAKATEAGETILRRLHWFEREAYPAAQAALADRDIQLAAVRSDIEKLRGDIHHLVNPIIGHLRLLDHKKEPLTTEHVEHSVDRLRLVVALLDEAATGEVASDEHRGRHGVGLNHYPALSAASPAISPEAVE